MIPLTTSLPNIERKRFGHFTLLFIGRKLFLIQFLLNSVYGAGNYHVNKNSFIPIVTFVLNSFEQKE